MYKIIAILIVVSLGLFGCQETVSPPPTTTQSNTVKYDLEVPDNLTGKTWISPGLVEISGMYPGAEAEWVVRIHNGNPEPTTFTVSYKFPNNTKDGYSMPLLSTKNWVTVEHPTVTLQPDETRDVLVNLNIPSGVTISLPKFEFWVAVVEKTDTMVETELASRWLVTMK